MLFHQWHIFVRKSNLSILIQRTSFLPQSRSFGGVYLNFRKQSKGGYAARPLKNKRYDPSWRGQAKERAKNQNKKKKAI